MADDAQAITQPLHHRTTDEHTAFERVFHTIAHFPRHCGQQFIIAWNGLRARIEQHEAARAIRIFRHATLMTRLTKRCSLLITGNARDFHAATEQTLHRFAIHLAAGAHFGQHTARHIQNAQQLIVPLPRMNIEQQRAARITHVGDVQRAAG